MPTETTKLGGLLTALTNICEAPPLPASPEKTYSDDNVVQVVTADNAVAPQPTSSVEGATNTSLLAAARLPQPTSAFTGIQNLTAAAATNTTTFSNNTQKRSSKYKPAPPPYPPPGYYNNKEKFLDSDDNSNEDSDDEDEVQYFDSFESDEFDVASSASRSSYSVRSSAGGGRAAGSIMMLPTNKKNARARARSLPSKLRDMPDDPPTRKYTKRKKSSSSTTNNVSTARPKLGGGGGISASSSKKPSSSKGEAIQHPTPEDILAGRGGGTNRHDGNIRFRDEARKLRIIYKDGETDRRTKYMISQELVTRVRQYGGRFLEKGWDGRWYEMDELSARKKASQVLREEKWD